jgi:hypothetical protein
MRRHLIGAATAETETRALSQQRAKCPRAVLPSGFKT